MRDWVPPEKIPPTLLSSTSLGCHFVSLLALDYLVVPAEFFLGFIFISLTWIMGKEILCSCFILPS